MSYGYPDDAETVMSLASRAYVLSLINRGRLEDIIGFCLEAQRTSNRVGYPFGLPSQWDIEDAEQANRERLSKLRCGRHALVATLKEAIYA